jgi:hypothetical protein
VPDWQRIDIFVYFSHSLVTLPPPVWTNAAHRAGTRVLGTVCRMCVCARLGGWVGGSCPFLSLKISRVCAWVWLLSDQAAHHGVGCRCCHLCQDFFIIVACARICGQACGTGGAR